MKRAALLFSLLILISAVPAGAETTTIEGMITGFDCLVKGQTCPAGKEEPFISSQSMFVVIAPDNKYYFVPNIGRTVMARHYGEQVRVSGDMNPRYNSIQADRFDLKQGSRWKTIWSPDMEKGIGGAGGPVYD